MFYYILEFNNDSLQNVILLFIKELKKKFFYTFWAQKLVHCMHQSCLFIMTYVTMYTTCIYCML